MSCGLSIGLVQASLAWQDPAANRAQLGELIGGFNKPVDLLVLPETFTTGFLGQQPDPEDQFETLSWMRDIARQRFTSITGSIAFHQHGQWFNRLFWVEPDGSTRHYDKKHLFSFSGEQKRYQAGDQRVVWDWQDWRVCPQICYDLRFPVWCRNRADYDLLVFVANWPTPRADAWTTLLRARAMENQAYVIGVNRTGQDGNGHCYAGASAVLDPLGRQLLTLDSDEQVASVMIDLDTLEHSRGQFPFQQDADLFELK